MVLLLLIRRLDSSSVRDVFLFFFEKSPIFQCILLLFWTIARDIFYITLHFLNIRILFSMDWFPSTYWLKNIFVYFNIWTHFFFGLKKERNIKKSYLKEKKWLTNLMNVGLPWVFDTSSPNSDIIVNISLLSNDFI